MALKAVVTALTDLPAEQQAFYTKAEDGTYVLDAEVDDHPKVKGLKNALKREKDEQRQVRDEYFANRFKQEFEGKSPDEVRAAVDAAERADRDRATRAGDTDRLLQVERDKARKAMEQKDADLAARTAAYHRALIDAAATTELAAVTDSPRLLRPHLLADLMVVEQDGMARVVVRGADGKQALNDQGDPVTIPALLQQMRQQKELAPAFRGDGVSGSGAPPSPGGAPADTSHLSPEARLDRVFAGGAR